MDQHSRQKLQYTVLANRISHWHQLLWQVPLFAFTAQAFTFTIALAPDTSRFARLIACGLSLLISLVSLATLVRQRKADLVDSKQLRGIEDDWKWSKEERLHGKPWADKRAAKKFDWKWLDSTLGGLKLTSVWAVAFLVLLALAVLIAVATFVSPGAFVDPPLPQPTP